MGPLTFTTADGLALEGEIRAAEGHPRGTAVLCHPHPQHGGSKDHPVLWAIRNDLAGRRGLTVLSFNFRGTLGSQGEHGGGEDERRDVAAAVDRVRREVDGPTVLVGWSFGAVMAVRHAVGDPRVAALVLVGVPVGEASIIPFPIPTRGELSSLRARTLLAAGAADQLCPVPEMRMMAGRMPSAEVLVLPDTDHFFWRRERELAERVGTFVDRALDAPPLDPQ
jgi:alpha/beta superfamily hydrolase